VHRQELRDPAVGAASSVMRTTARDRRRRPEWSHRDHVVVVVW
jgi:hypothetical protein